MNGNQIKEFPRCYNSAVGKDFCGFQGQLIVCLTSEKLSTPTSFP